jgi:hypothetical protein
VTIAVAPLKIRIVLFYAIMTPFVLKNHSQVDYFCQKNVLQTQLSIPLRDDVLPERSFSTSTSARVRHV